MPTLDNLLSATVFPSLSVFGAACLCLLVAEGVKVLLGFGGGLIAVGSLALVMPTLQDAVVLFLLITLPSELFVVFDTRKSIDWKGIVTICVGLVVGIPTGTALLSLGDASAVLAVLGLFLLVVGPLFLLLPADLSLRLPGWSGGAAGLVGGVLSGMFGTGGPPIILYFRLSGLPKAAFRGQLMAVFTVVSLVRLPSYAVGGLLTEPRLWSALCVLPVVLLGAYAGHKTQLQLDEKTFSRLVAAALAALGIMLLWRWWTG